MGEAEEEKEELRRVEASLRELLVGSVNRRHGNQKAEANHTLEVIRRCQKLADLLDNAGESTVGDHELVWKCMASLGSAVFAAHVIEVVSRPGLKTRTIRKALHQTYTNEMVKAIKWMAEEGPDAEEFEDAADA